jgi:hypothetical protein
MRSSHYLGETCNPERYFILLIEDDQFKLRGICAKASVAEKFIFWAKDFWKDLEITFL